MTCLSQSRRRENKAWKIPNEKPKFSFWKECHSFTGKLISDNNHFLSTRTDCPRQSIVLRSYHCDKGKEKEKEGKKEKNVTRTSKA